MNNRMDWVDYAKAIGIILVVYGHVARGLYNGGLELSVPLYKLIDSIIYTFHMPLFFFLSGLFFYNSFVKRGTKKFVFNKIDTIFYPYVIWSLLQGTIEVFLSPYTNNTTSFSDLLSILWEPRAQFWFLYALFSVFVISSFIYSVAPKKSSVLIFLFAVTLYLFPAILLPNLNIFRHFIAENLVYFCFGIIFTMYVNMGLLSNKCSLFISFLAFIIGQWIFHDYLSLDFRHKGIELLLLAFVSITFIVSLSSFLSKQNYSFFALIGASSMAIYLMHILAGSGTRILLVKILGVNSFSINLVVGTLVALFVPMAILAVINKYKIPFVFSAPVTSWIGNRNKKS